MRSLLEGMNLLITLLLSLFVSHCLLDGFEVSLAADSSSKLCTLLLGIPVSKLNSYYLQQSKYAQSGHGLSYSPQHEEFASSDHLLVITLMFDRLMS